MAVGPVADLTAIHMRQDEAGQDEEEVDRQPGALDEREADPSLGDDVQLIVEEHDAEGEPEPDAGQGRQPIRKGLRRRVGNRVGAAALRRKSGHHQTRRDLRNGR